ncbi:MAG TPA: hypothetical protein VG273_19655 [Bryobacteraceae bacterium]|jgi:hypothetical protein|nr:hypothetical protein [Bryobacteraceae bacterium]
MRWQADDIPDGLAGGLTGCYPSGRVRDRREIEAILKDRLSRAQRDYENARGEFKAFTSDIPSGLPFPDGTERIRNAGKALNFAISRYSAALDDFKSFIIEGVVPEYLRENTNRNDTSQDDRDKNPRED